LYFSGPHRALMADGELMSQTRIDARLLELRKRFVRNLPERIAAIVETLRQRQDGLEHDGTLDRQFHNLAGTAGTFGFFAIAAAALDGFDECAGLKGAKIDGEARYLWAIVEELANEACDPDALERATEAIFHSMYDHAVPEVVSMGTEAS
jgi:HPt (histidine-containing phosphotransfer) domain-containing protein